MPAEGSYFSQYKLPCGTAAFKYTSQANPEVMEIQALYGGFTGINGI